MFSTMQGANTNALHPDHATALYVTTACAAALASFGQNQLEDAAAALKTAEDAVYSVADELLQKRLVKLCTATAEAMLSIDIGALVRAGQGTTL